MDTNKVDAFQKNGMMIMQKLFLKQTDASKLAQKKLGVGKQLAIPHNNCPKAIHRCDFSIPLLGLGSCRLKNGNSPNGRDHLRSMLFELSAFKSPLLPLAN